MLHKFGLTPEGHASCFPTLLQLSDALQVWAVCQEGPNFKVMHAAEIFNVAPQAIVDAATIHPLLVVEDRGKDDIRLWTIGHDDE